MGDDCLEWSSATICFFVFNNMVPIIVSFCTMMVGIYLLVVLTSKETKRNALFYTTIFATLGSASMLALCVTFSVAARRGPSIVIVNGVKTDKATIPEGIFLVTTFIFLTMSCFNISLVWIEIGNASSRLRLVSGRIQLRTYRAALAVLNAIIGIAIVAALIAKSTLALIIAPIPGFILVAVTYLVGWYRLKPLLETPSREASMRKEMVEKKQRMLALIARTALTLSLLSVTFVGSLVAAAYFYATGTGITPVSHTYNIFSGLYGECACFMQAAVMGYCVVCGQHSKDGRDSKTLTSSRDKAASRADTVKLVPAESTTDTS